MSPVRVVAFDGTPVAGGAGVRVAVLQLSDGSIVTKSGRRLSTTELSDLVKDGYVTAIQPPIEAAHDNGVVIYRNKDFTFPGVSLDEDGVNWFSCGDNDVRYLDPSEATTVFQGYAQIAYIQARASLNKRALDKVRLFARRGLMVGPQLRCSAVAAKLYGVLLAAESLEEQPTSVLREIKLILDKTRAQAAIDLAAEAIGRRMPQAFDLRRTDRLLEVGSVLAPREAA